MENLNQHIGYARHNEKLCACTYEDIMRSTGKNTEIIGGERKTHRQHDKTQNNSLCSPSDPQKEIWHKEGKHRNSDDKQGGVACEPSAQTYKKMHLFIIFGHKDSVFSWNALSLQKQKY